MGFLVGCEEVAIEFPGKQILRHTSIGVSDGDRIGIVGCNGDGKSTLLGLIAGCIEPDEGQVTRRRGLQVSYLRQEDSLDPSSTIEEGIFGGAPTFEWASNPKIRGIVSGLLSDLELDGRISKLSGGQRRRVDLVRSLVQPCDLLLLDEPTNHLDIVAIQWLAEHLKGHFAKRTGGLLVVTHDRWFLDEVCNSMWEVHDSSVDPFEGGFSAYVLQRVQRDEEAAKAERKRQNQLRRELAWLSRGARARSSKPKFHLEQAKALIADVPELRNAIELKRTAVARLGKQVISLFSVSCRYGEASVIDDVTWHIGAGERIGVLGRNGAGKTTLINLISGRIKPSEGHVRIGSTVRFATLSQYLNELDEYRDKRVRELISNYKSSYVADGKELSPAQMLERLGFKRQELSAYVCSLSGGQRRRLQLLLTLLAEPNVLILDEPGNDMDTDMLAVMEDLLDTWPGTLILVTHDRYLMERVTEDQFALIDGKIVHMAGGVQQYLDIAQGLADAPGQIGFAGDERPTGDKAATHDGLAAEEKPGLSGGQLHALKKAVASTERRLKSATERESEAAQALREADPTDYNALQAAQACVDEARALKEGLEERWLELAGRLEESQK